MLVLGLETSTSQSSVCLAGEQGVVAAAESGRGRAHSEFLMPAVQFCLRHAGLDIGAVTGVAVGLGPGLYTGMRVGIASAQALAHARGLPAVGVTSLDLLAFGVRYSHGLIASVIDARRKELFWAFYRARGGEVRRIADLRVGPPDKLAGEIEAAAADTICVGDGALAQRNLLESAGAEVASVGRAYPDARSLCELALPRFARDDVQRPEDLRPVYLRRADARINWEQRGALVGGVGTDPPAPLAAVGGQ